MFIASLPHITWIIISITSTAIYFVMSANFLRNNPEISIHYLMGWSHIAAAAIILPFINQETIIHSLNSGVLVLLLKIALLTWIAKMLYYFAYSKIAVAQVTIFSSLTPIYAILFGFALGYPLLNKQIIGITIVSASIMLFFAHDIRARMSKKRLNQMSSNTFPLICAFLSTIPTALSGFLQKDAMIEGGVLFVSFFVCAFLAIASLTYLKLYDNRPPVAKNTSVYVTIGMIGFLLAIATLSFSLFLYHAHPAVAQSLQRLSSLLQIVLAHIFLKQTFNTKLHLYCVSMSVIGIWILVL